MTCTSYFSPAASACIATWSASLPNIYALGPTSKKGTPISTTRSTAISSDRQLPTSSTKHPAIHPARTSRSLSNDGNAHGPFTGPHLVEVHKPESPEEAKRNRTIDHRRGLRAAKDHGPQRSVSVQRPVRLLMPTRHSSLDVLRPGVTVLSLSLGSDPGDEALENRLKIHHEELITPVVDVIRDLLDQDAARGVLRVHREHATLDPRLRQRRLGLSRDVVECYTPVRLNLERVVVDSHPGYLL